MVGEDLELLITAVVAADDEQQARTACAGLVRQVGGRVVRALDCSDEEPGCWSVTISRISGERAGQNVAGALARAVRTFVRMLGDDFPTPRVACEPPTAWTVLEDPALLDGLVPGAERLLVEAWAGGDPQHHVQEQAVETGSPHARPPHAGRSDSGPAHAQPPNAGPPHATPPRRGHATGGPVDYAEPSRASLIDGGQPERGQGFGSQGFDTPEAGDPTHDRPALGSPIDTDPTHDGPTHAAGPALGGPTHSGPTHSGAAHGGPIYGSRSGDLSAQPAGPAGPPPTGLSPAQTPPAARQAGGSRLVLRVDVAAERPAGAEWQARAVASRVARSGKITRVAPQGHLLSVHIDLGSSVDSPTVALRGAVASLGRSGWSSVEWAGGAATTRWSASPTPPAGIAALELTATPTSAFVWTVPD